MTCQNCPYCQIQGKFLCANCEKCQEVSEPSLTQLPDGMLSLSFKNALILEKTIDMDLLSFEVANQEFVEALKLLLQERPSSQVIGFEEFREHFSSFYKVEAFEGRKEDFYLFYVGRKLSEISILEKKMSILKTQKTFAEFFTPGNNSLNTQTLPKIIVKEEKSEAIATNPCLKPKAYTIKIKPDQIKVGIDGILRRPMNVVVLSNPECVQREMNLAEIARQVTVSLGVIIVTNFLQEVLFSLLNNKDILDIVKYTHTPETEIFLKFEEFFTTFSCNDFSSFFSGQKSFLSNTKIKSALISGYSESLSSRLKAEGSDEWFNEYFSQYRRRFSKTVSGAFSCVYNLVWPEYLALDFLGLFLLMKFILEFRLLWEARKNKPCAKLILRIKKVKNFFFDLFFNALLFVYFYNLVAFCTLLKLVSTLRFGILDFCILIIRSGFLMFPLFKFLKDFNLVSKELKKRQESRHKEKEARKKKKKKIISTKNKPTVRRNFTKMMPTKRIYGFWERKKNTVKAFVRISFLGRNRDDSKPSIKRKVLRYHLEIINDRRSKSLRRTEKQSKVALL